MTRDEILASRISMQIKICDCIDGTKFSDMFRAATLPALNPSPPDVTPFSVSLSTSGKFSVKSARVCLELSLPNLGAVGLVWFKEGSQHPVYSLGTTRLD